MNERHDVTMLLARARGGDDEAVSALIPLVYQELRRLAAAIMRRERPGHTLQPTAVVHEAFLKIVDGESITFEDRAHFFAIAARSMRQILVDHARRRVADKRGGKAQQPVELDEGIALTLPQSEELLAVHEALTALEQLDPRQARIVEMHYFAGNGIEEIAAVLDISERTVKRELQTARLFLKQQLHQL